MVAARRAGVGQAELIGIQEQGVGVIDLEDFLLTIEPVLLLCEGIDESVAERIREGPVFAPGCLDLVGMCIFIFLNFPVVFVLQ